MESFLSRCDQWLFDMSPGIVEFLSLNQILLVKLKNVSFQLADLKLYRHQFCPFSNVIHHLELRNVYLIKIWRHQFLLLHPPLEQCAVLVPCYNAIWNSHTTIIWKYTLIFLSCLLTVSFITSNIFFSDQSQLDPLS